MPTRILARVYLPEGRNLRVSTTPGRSVQFFGGCAQIVDGRDMPHMLQMEGARVQPEPDAMPWAPEWLGTTDQIRAKVIWPAGYRVSHRNRDDWKLTAPKAARVPEAQASAPDPVREPEAPTEPPSGGERPWVPGMRPEDLVSNPDAA